MVKKLHDIGVRSEHAYLAGTSSIVLALGTWMLSKNKEKAGLERADRWGIFIGEWAPTFFALGNALRTYER